MIQLRLNIDRNALKFGILILKKKKCIISNKLHCIEVVYLILKFKEISHEIKTKFVFKRN